MGPDTLFLRVSFFCPYNPADEETEAEKNQVLCQGHPAGRWRNRAQNSDDLNYGFYKDLVCAKHSESAKVEAGNLSRAETRKGLLKTPRLHLPTAHATPTLPRTA